MQRKNRLIVEVGGGSFLIRKREDENGDRTFKEWLLSSHNTVILTGAGMSMESEVPDFRLASGWWKQMNPRTVATTEALMIITHYFMNFIKHGWKT